MHAQKPEVVIVTVLAILVGSYFLFSQCCGAEDEDVHMQEGASNLDSVVENYKSEEDEDYGEDDEEEDEEEEDEEEEAEEIEEEVGEPLVELQE